MTAVLALSVLMAICVTVAGLEILEGRRHRPRPIILDPERVRAAVRARALGGIPDGHFDRLCDELRARYECDAAFVTLLDDHLQTMKGMSGLPEDRRVLPLDYSICQFVVVAGRALEFPDTRVAPDLARCKAVDDVGAYFGEPLMFEDQRVGAVGLIDHRPRHDLTGLVQLAPYAAQVTRELARRALAAPALP